MAPAVIYLSWRYYAAVENLLPTKSWPRYILPLFLCSFYLFPIGSLIFYWLNGGIDILAFSHFLDYWFWLGLIFVYALATWIIIADVVKLLFQWMSDKRTLINRLYGWGILLLFIIISFYTGFKTFKDTTEIRTQNIDLKVSDWPSRLDGFKIIHISDIHADEYTGQKKIARYIHEVNKLQPDLIIFTGDLISYGTDYIKMAARELGKAKAPYGTIAVVGDHDYWAGVENVKRALAEEGIPTVQDSNYTVAVDSSTHVLFTGVTQVYSKKVLPAVADSLSQHSGAASLKIFATHQVADFLIKDAQKYRYDIMLAGHTHGGQVRVPFMGMNFSPSNLETDFISGIFHLRKLVLNVNNGLGFTLAPIRYDAPPNISVIRLTANRDS